MSDRQGHADVTSVDDDLGARDDGLSINHGPLDGRDEKSLLEVVPDEAALFASPLPITGERKTTTRTELWVSCDPLGGS